MKKLISTALAMIMMLSLLVTGCGSPKDDAAVVKMTASGDAEVSADATLTYGVANFYMQTTQVYYDAVYGSYYGSSFWSMAVGTDASGNATSTMADSLKDSMLESLEAMMVLRAYAPLYNVSLSDEEEEAITQAAEQFISDNTDKANKAMGASQAIVEEYLRMTAYQTKMQEAIYAEADVDIDEADAAARTFSYAKIPLTSTDASGNATTITGDELAEYEASAQAIVDNVAAGSDFETELTGNGLTAQTYSYTKNDTGMDSAVLEAADGLSEGEVTMAEVEGDAIYLIRLDSAYDEEATQANIESLTQQAQQSYYYQVVDELMAKMNFEVNEDLWDKIPFDVMYTTVSNESGDASTDSSADAASSDAE